MQSTDSFELAELSKGNDTASPAHILLPTKDIGHESQLAKAKYHQVYSSLFIDLFTS